jgi:hypothetical protein
MLGKIKIFLGKSFEKLFPQQLPPNFPQKITFRGKNVRKIGPKEPILPTIASYDSVVKIYSATNSMARF